MRATQTDAEEWYRLLDALNHPYRRRLIGALLEHNPQTAEGGLEAEFELESATGVGGDEVASDIQIVHNHLPKLESYGYVSWDETTGEISKGPNWEEVEPLFQLLADHQDELGLDWP